MVTEPRPEIDAELKAKVALAALWEQTTVADLAMKFRGPQSSEKKGRSQSQIGRNQRGAVLTRLG